MTLDFHFTDTPPQVYLDGLHGIDVPKLYDPLLSKQQRGNLMVLIKKRLSDWQQKVQTQIKSIEGRYDKQNQDKARLIAAPYKKLDSLGNDLNKAIADLERTIRAGRVLPQGFSIGNHIFGDLERGEWHLGDSDDVHLWGEYSEIRRRLETLGREYKQLIQGVKISQARVKQQQSDLQAMMKKYKWRKSPLNLILKVVPVLLVAVFALAMGWAVFSSPDPVNEVLTNQSVAATFVSVGVIGLILLVVLLRRRKRHLDDMKENITQGKRLLKDLQAAYKQARLDFYPTDKLYKELQGEYKILKATFPT